jgi:hypothetical protein
LEKSGVFEMLTQDYNEKAQFHYYNALIAIRKGKEHDASAALNAARDAVLGGRYFTDLSAQDMQQIAPDLTEQSFYALHGDYGYKAKTIGKAEKIHWVPQSLKPMVEAHFTQFEAQFGDIGGKTWEIYNAQRNAEDGPQISAGVA